MARPAGTWPTDVEGQLAAAEAELRDALIVGGSTAGIRQRITAIQREATAIADAAAAEQAEITRARQETIDARSREIAADAAARLVGTLDGLMPPPPPI